MNEITLEAGNELLRQINQTKNVLEHLKDDNCSIELTRLYGQDKEIPEDIKNQVLSVISQHYRTKLNKLKKEFAEL